VSLDWNRGELAEGLACYRRREFFEAHEHWESVWLCLEEPEKSFVQAVIQMTAAFHHLQKGNFVGAASLLRRTARRLETCPASFGGIAVVPLFSEIRRWIQALERGKPGQPHEFPKITLEIE
jgi:predicted metal-dependent hydrolase